MSNYFIELNQIDVNEHTEKKGNFTYLSWAFAWAEVKKKYPDATFNVHRFGEDNKPYLLDDDLGYMVFTDLTINDITHEMWLPVMDYRNQAIQKGGASMMDINKAIMRCLVKNIAMHGIGLYIYAGEDLPEEEVVPVSKEQVKEINELYGDRVKGMLKHYKLKKLEDMDSRLAEQLLERIKKQTEEKEKQEEPPLSKVNNV